MIQIKKAVRERIFLKLVVTGATGSGKTKGAICIARDLSPSGKIGVIDTENRSASYYASDINFDVIELDAPFTTAKYLEALRAFVDGGYEAVVIDSLTHEWAASGGILDQKSQKDARGGNSFTNWNEMKQLHNKFVETMLQSHVHIVCTLRSKMEYVMEQNEKGKAEVRKLGLAPISSDGMEYEFGVMFDIDRNSHLAVASKDRTGLFEGRSFELANEPIGRELRTWLESGATMTQPQPTTAPATAPNVTASPAGKVATRTTQPRAQSVAQPVAQPPKSGGTQSIMQEVSKALTPTDPPAEWVAAMTDLCEITIGMPEKTRKALISGFEADGPSALEALRAEVQKIRSVLNPDSPAAPTAGSVIAELPPLAKKQASQAASDFVEGVDPTPPDTDEASGGISADQYAALNNLVKIYGLKRDALRAYMQKSGHLLPGANGPTLARMKADEFVKLRDKLYKKDIAANNETWSARTVRIINATPIPSTKTPGATDVPF